MSWLKQESRFTLPEPLFYPDPEQCGRCPAAVGDLYSVHQFTCQPLPETSSQTPPNNVLAAVWESLSPVRLTQNDHHRRCQSWKNLGVKQSNQRDCKAEAPVGEIYLRSKKALWLPKWGGRSWQGPIAEGLVQFSLVQFSRSVMSDSLRPHGLQHARLHCPSPTPGVYSNSRPLSR